MVDLALTIAQAAAAEPMPVMGSQTAIILAVTFFLGALVFFLLEMVFPSFGLLTICGLGCVVGSCICAFAISNAVGASFVALNVLSIPIVVFLAFKLLPRSPLVVQSAIESSVPAPQPMARESREELEHLVGRAGVAITRLNPGGTARIGEKKYDVVSDGEWIEPDTSIEVASVEGHRIEVKAREV